MEHCCRSPETWSIAWSAHHVLRTPEHWSTDHVPEAWSIAWSTDHVSVGVLRHGALDGAQIMFL